MIKIRFWHSQNKIRFNKVEVNRSNRLNRIRERLTGRVGRFDWRRICRRIWRVRIPWDCGRMEKRGGRRSDQVVRILLSSLWNHEMSSLRFREKQRIGFSCRDRGLGVYCRFIKRRRKWFLFVGITRNLLSE